MRTVAAFTAAVLVVVAIGVGTMAAIWNPQQTGTLTGTLRLSGMLYTPPLAGTVFLYPSSMRLKDEVILCSAGSCSPPPPAPLHGSLRIAVRANGVFSAVVPAGSYLVLGDGPRSVTGDYSCYGGNVKVTAGRRTSVVVGCPSWGNLAGS